MKVDFSKAMEIGGKALKVMNTPWVLETPGQILAKEAFNVLVSVGGGVAGWWITNKLVLEPMQNSAEETLDESEDEMVEESSSDVANLEHK